MLHVPPGPPNCMLLHIDCEMPFGDKCRRANFSGLSGGCENMAWIIHTLALNDLLTIIFCWNQFVSLGTFVCLLSSRDKVKN